ncbi:MAG: hypothetical protein OdinLCB4_005800 [Candidatus Odinarchaeum yellowstonii]|uniref:Uncharacterized protein n=1 Tax=Odinarchaeota yellowstonii (strain LCB_4) TaxID=1841599 RepID=A0AAF0D1I2_ODILC|nr:MAG: hypothetical protein OdinLCB4_005800 [Candidatus Odinarchaeum yellowstonii]
MNNERNIFTFRITASGELKIIENPPILDEENIFLVVDDDNSCSWLYIGLNTTLIHRRAALRAANSIKRFGYSFNNKTIGSRCREFIIIDADDESTVRESKTQRLKSVFTLPHAKTVFKTTEPREVESTIFKNGLLIRPIEELNEQVKDSNQQVSRREILDKSSELSADTGYRKLGVLLTSILLKYPDIKILRLGEYYVVNSPDKSLCRVKVKNDRLIVSNSLNFGGEEEKYEIQKKFIGLMEKSKTMFKDH